MLADLQPGNHGTPPAAIVGGAAKIPSVSEDWQPPRSSPPPNAQSRTNAAPLSNDDFGLPEVAAARGVQVAPGVAARGSVAVVRTVLAEAGKTVTGVGACARAVPMATVPGVSSAKTAGARPMHRGPSEITRRRRDGGIPDQPPVIPSPPNCPFLSQSLKYTLAFGPDPCRNRILALFEFWANLLPKEDGIVSVPASLTWICEGLFFEFSRHEVSKAMGRLHEAGLITRPARGPHDRRSPGRRDILTFHVDAVNERIRNAVAGTDGYRYDDWTDLSRKRFPSEYHKAANHTGPYNQCTTCTGWRMTDVADPTTNQGTALTGSPANQGTAYTGGRARRSLVKVETRVPGALHKGSSVEKEEEANTTVSLPSFAAKTENFHTVTEPRVQVEAPTPIPRCATPLTPITEEPENELQGSSVMPLGDPRVRELLDTYPEQLTARHASLIVERFKDPEFAARYTQILGDASQIVNERIPKPVLWALEKKADGAENWKKILDGKMSGFMKGPRRIAGPVQSLAQDARSAATQDAQKPVPTPKDLYAKRRRPLENRADALGLLRHPEFQQEWQRRHEESIDNGWDQRSLDWLEKQVVRVDQMGWAKPGKPITEEAIRSLLLDSEGAETGVSADAR